MEIPPRIVSTCGCHAKKNAKVFKINIFFKCSKILKIKFELKPQTFLLKILPEHIHEKYYHLLRYMLTTTINLAQHWKNNSLPSILAWETKIKDYAALPKLTMYRN